MKPFFVHLLWCADRSFYVGHTDDLERRFAQHVCGECGGYTHSRRPVELVWFQETASRDEALAAERQLKGWSRAKKDALIVGDWSRISRLAKSAQGLRQAQPERCSPDHPGLVEGQAQPERCSPDHPGLVEEQAQPERRSPDHPELVEGLKCAN